MASPSSNPTPRRRRSAALQTIARIERRRPPTWDLAARLAIADGVRAPSAQHAGGVNLVLWRWNRATGATRVAAIDPDHDLSRDDASW